MNRLTLKFSLKKKQHLIVEMDGMRITPTIEESGRAVYSYDTDSNKVSVRIFTEPNELLVRHWFLRVLLYYFISIFGLFDWAYTSNPYIIDYSMEYDVDADTVIELSWDKTRNRVFKAKAGSEYVVDNGTNVYIHDKRIKRRYIGMVLFKVLSWIAIFLIIILIMMR